MQALTAVPPCHSWVNEVSRSCRSCTFLLINKWARFSAGGRRTLYKTPHLIAQKVWGEGISKAWLEVQTSIVHPVRMDWICNIPFVLLEVRLKWTVLLGRVQASCRLRQALLLQSGSRQCVMEVCSYSIYVLFAWKDKINITHFNILVTELSISSFTLMYLFSDGELLFMGTGYLVLSLCLYAFFFLPVFVAFVYHCHQCTQLHFCWS